jgi:integrase
MSPRRRCSKLESIIRPQLGSREVAKLTPQDISDWHQALANAPARLRTRAGAQQNVRETTDSEESRRQRRSSANRIFTILKAALNVAYRNGNVASDDAWRRVKPFAKADAAKFRYLSDDEARRLTNGCEPKLRPMVQAALLTGARYSELANLETRDFDRQSGTVWLRETKGGEPRPVYLEAEGVRLFDQATAGKEGGGLVFTRPEGGKWGASQQSRRLAAACVAAKVEPAGFHDLRRTYGARLALQGVPLAVIAQALGHKDERVTRKHYAHLCKSYVADTVRSAAAGLGIVAPSNVRKLGTAAAG